MKKLIWLVMLLISGSVYADASLPPQTISRIETGWGSEGLYLSFAENNKVEGCTNSRVRFERDHPMLKDILSIALSAFHAGKKVQVRVSGCLGADHKGIAIAVVQ
ncbi:hypothetical protein [Vibrio mangrovi]|uniref:Uncharacterized protein n=1 Tax=Vibrio mangrovi TaxID=474394 RepID=A0A1Y6J0Q0_9VIBR|nr:hypothetical protein [Vibrio mangrovi]MDW6002615.1 hypothetical protein [Vibrio mangrovi]SMS01853.1 hypothetical protein VIM7927_03162 [Vibrio mangrovi]